MIPDGWFGVLPIFTVPIGMEMSPGIVSVPSTGWLVPQIAEGPCHQCGIWGSFRERLKVPSEIAVKITSIALPFPSQFGPSTSGFRVYSMVRACGGSFLIKYVIIWFHIGTIDTEAATRPIGVLSFLPIHEPTT